MHSWRSSAYGHLVVLLICAALYGAVARGESAGPALEGWYEVRSRSSGGSTILTVQGWAVSPSGEVRVTVLVDGREVLSGKPFLKWPGVAEKFPQIPGADFSGFQASIDSAAFGVGEHSIAVELSTPDGRQKLRLPETAFRTAPPLTALIALPVLFLLLFALPAVAGVWLARRASLGHPEADRAFEMRGWRLHAVLVSFAVALIAVVLVSPRFGMLIPSERGGPFGALANWDGGFYHIIAERGYGAHAESAYAFFPLFPLVLKLLGFLPIPVELAASMLNVVLFVSAIEIMRRSGTADRVLLLFAALPFSVFFVVNYTESLALLLCVAVIRSASEDAPKTAFVAGVLAGMTRVTGVALAFLAVDAVRQRKWTKAVALATGPPLGLACFCAYLWFVSGDPFAFVHVQERFGRSTVPAPGYLLSGLQQTVRDQGGIGLWSALVAALILIGAAYLVRKGRWGEGLYCATLIYLPLMTGRITSINRYALLAVPVLLVLFTSIRSKRAVWVLLGIEVLLACYYAAQFGRQAWIG